jgi:predicted ribonuclease YlaK
MNIIDTNVLMSHPNIITKEKDIIIPTDVLKELDGLKSNINSEVAF